jgi:hypothetical protein
MARPEITGQKSAELMTGTSVPPPVRGSPVAPACFSIPTFCTAHHISEAFYYKMQRAGWGPREMHVGRRTLISIEAAAEWRAAREQAGTSATTTPAS